MSREFTIRTPSRVFHVCTGTEGPRHDPYSYTEYTIERKGHASVTYHCGLGEWISMGKRRLGRLPNKAELALPWQDCERAFSRRLRATFARYSGGLTPEQLEDCHRRIRSRCNACGCRHTKAERGYPGETLYVCVQCNNVVDSDFDRSAIE